jgi:hypothetical protein
LALEAFNTGNYYKAVEDEVNSGAVTKVGGVVEAVGEVERQRSNNSSNDNHDDDNCQNPRAVLRSR